MDSDYKQQREALLAHLARAEQSYKENLERVARLTAKADALEKECEQKDCYIAELTNVKISNQRFLNKTQVHVTHCR